MACVKGTDPVSAYLKSHMLNYKPYQLSVADGDGDASVGLFVTASGRRILENEVKFEKVPAYSTVVADKLKEKYKLLVTSKKLSAVFSSSQHEGSSNLTPKISSDKGVSNLINSEELPSPSTELFPENGVQLGWKGFEPVGAGMMNLGNTCYLNSILQALFHVPSFCNWLTTQAVHNGIGKCDHAFLAGEMCIICAMAATLRISRSQTGHVIKPALIYGRLKSICRHLSLGQQEDAHEFLRFLIESMEKTFLLQYKGKKLDCYSKETTPLHRIFGGYLRNEVSCHSCGRVSTTFQLFQDLFLDIRLSESLTQSMKGFFSWEKLEGGEKDNCYKCERCSYRGNCRKRVYIQTPPKVLCIQLKRFTALGKKITKHISYPIKLDLSPFIYNGLIKNDSIHNGIVRPLLYKLVSVVSHYGAGLHCGHYTAIGISAKGSYFMFDDSQVKPVSNSTALGTNAYILMYEMEANWLRSKGAVNSNMKQLDYPHLNSPKLILTHQGETDLVVSTLRASTSRSLKPEPLKLKLQSVNLFDEAKSTPKSNVENVPSDTKNNINVVLMERRKHLEEKCLKADIETKVKSVSDEGTLGEQNHLVVDDIQKNSLKYPLKRSLSTADSKSCKKQLTLPDIFRKSHRDVIDVKSSQHKIRTLKDWLVNRESYSDEQVSRKCVNLSKYSRWSVNGWKVTENNNSEEDAGYKRKRDEDRYKRKRKLVDSEIFSNFSERKIPFLSSDDKSSEEKGRTKVFHNFQNNGLFQ